MGLSVKIIGSWLNWAYVITALGFSQASAPYLLIISKYVLIYLKGSKGGVRL
jgi:hypothetical protein